MKRGLVFLISLLVVSLSLFVSAQEVQLTSDLNIVSYDVSGNFVAFSTTDVISTEEVCSGEGEERICTMGETLNKVYLYDLTSDKQTEIGKGSFPIIYKNRYIFFNDQEDNLALYDLQIPGPWGIFADDYGLNSQMCSANSNTLFCYDPSGVFYFYNETLGIFQELFHAIIDQNIISGYIDGMAYHNANVKEIDSSNDYIVYTQDAMASNGDSITTDVWMYDLDSSTETRITNNDESQMFPKVSGDTIVWAESRTDSNYIGGIKGYRLYYYNLQNQELYQLDLNYDLGRATPNIDFSDTKLVWRDSRHFNIPILGRLLYYFLGIGDNQEIYLYDFVTKEEERITKDSRDQSYPKVEGSKVFWLDNARDQSKKEQGINNLYYEDF